MKLWEVTLAVAVAACPAKADMRDEEHVVADRQVWIQVFEGTEIMWAGSNEYERTQVLSGPDIEIVAFVSDPESVAMVGVPAVVAVVPGSHSCEDLSGTPLLYSIISLGPTLATEGPLSTCLQLTVSITPGAVLLEENPGTGSGEFWAWSPGKGFRDTLD